MLPSAATSPLFPYTTLFRSAFTTAGVGKLDRNGGVVKIIGNLDNTGTTLALNANSGSWVLDGGAIIPDGQMSEPQSPALHIPVFRILNDVTLDSDLTIEDGS